MTTPKKILYGVCGIGNGHTFRQLPIIRHLADQGHQIVIFGYGASYTYFKDHFSHYPNVSVEGVSVPFYQGKAEGLDFENTARNPANQKDFLRVNCEAMASAEKLIGKPDLVISDYEPISTQYGYAHGAPLVTIDQQSKYLVGRFPEEIDGHTCQDEIMRLRMFFPLAEKRMACSFFTVPKRHVGNMEKVEIMPPVIRDEIIALKDSPKTETPSTVVYLTAQQPLYHSLEAMIEACKQTPSVQHHVFLSDLYTLPQDLPNVHFYHHGDPRFEPILGACHGIVATAGHTLLSEALYLGKPVYAMPLNLYEQQMNASVVEENGFGISHPTLTQEKLGEFIAGLPQYEENIAQDERILLRSPGQEKIIAQIERILQKRGISAPDISIK